MKLWSVDVAILLVLIIRIAQARVNKPFLTVNPDVSPLIRGQTVTLTCRISGGSGPYHWYKDGDNFNSSDEAFYTIKVDQSHIYKCYGLKDGQTTTLSDELTLSVIERPKAVLILQPDVTVFTGEKVTLTCEIREDADNVWIYSWYKDGVQLLHSVEENIFSFTPKESFRSKYTCSGERKSDSQTSEISTDVTLTVSEKPKPELTSSRNEVVLTGNSVTLTCTLQLQSAAGWKFYWNKHTQATETETETETHSYRIYSVKVSDKGPYRCRAGRGNPVYYTYYSDAFWVNVIESPKPVVAINPDTHVFRGETVSLRCEIQGEGDTEWTYTWDKLNSNLQHTEQELSFSPVRNEDSGQYTCTAWRSSDYQISNYSDAVTLTVSDNPEAVISVSSLSWLTEGDTVTLSCEVKHSAKGWTFSWYTDVLYRNSWGSLRYRTELLSDSSRGSGGSYTLSPVTLNHTGVYVCSAARGKPVFNAQYSKTQLLLITGKSPPVSLNINPSRTQHFTTHSLSLSCGDQSDSTGWTVRGYTPSGTSIDCPSATCNIRSLSTSHTGVYWCQSESKGRSNPINITVSNDNVILDSPVHPVTEGHPLTLRCLFRYKSSVSAINFYKDGSVFQINSIGEITISNVSKSHEGFYHCNEPQRGQSLKSWVSVNLKSSGPGSNIVIVAVAVGMSLILLLLIIISVILLWRHKSNKGKYRDIQQNSNKPPVQSQAGAEDSQTRNITPLQTGQTNSGGEHIYNTMDDADDAGPSDVTYTDLKFKPQKNTRKNQGDAGPSDVTYTDLKFKPQKNTRKNQVNSNVESDTVYSELKQNT